MGKNELSTLFNLRIDAQGRVFMLPQEIIDETVKAFSVSPTSATGYGSLGPPSGRYIAPADGLDCIETIRGEGTCGLQSLIVQGPLFSQRFSGCRSWQALQRPFIEPKAVSACVHLAALAASAT